jgi:hypothetical protein
LRPHQASFLSSPIFLVSLPPIRHGHAAKDMLQTSSDCRLDPIYFLGLVAKRMIASSFFVDQAFEFTEAEKFLKACI